MGHPTKLLDSRTNSTRGRTPRMYPPGRPSRHDSNIPRWYCQSEEWMRVGFESAEEAINTWVADQSAQCSSPQGFPLLDPRADYRITLEFHHILRVATRGYPIEPLQQDQKTYKTRSARRLVMPTHNGPPTTVSQPVVYGSILFPGALNACARLNQELYITLHLVSTDPHELTFDQGVTAPDRWCRCRPISIQGTPSSLRWTGSCGGLLPFPGTGEYLPTKSTTLDSASGPELPTGCYAQPAPHLSTTSSGQASTFHQKLKKRELAGVCTTQDC